MGGPSSASFVSTRASPTANDTSGRMDRRRFIQGMFGAAATTVLAEGCTRAGARPAMASPKSRAMTVRGWIDASDMGLTLPHEHALVSFQPYAEWARQPHVYDRDEVVRVVLPALYWMYGERVAVEANA